MGVRWERGTFGIFCLNKTAAPVCLGGCPWLCFQRHHLPVVISEEDVPRDPETWVGALALSLTGWLCDLGRSMNPSRASVSSSVNWVIIMSASLASSLDSREDRLLWGASRLFVQVTRGKYEGLSLCCCGLLGILPEDWPRPALLLPLGTAHPVSCLPTQMGSSHSASSQGLISEVLDRIISSPSHACLSGKITQPTQDPPTCTHTPHSHCLLHQPAEKQSGAWEEDAEAAGRGG